MASSIRVGGPSVTGNVSVPAPTPTLDDSHVYAALDHTYAPPSAAPHDDYEEADDADDGDPDFEVTEDVDGPRPSGRSMAKSRSNGSAPAARTSSRRKSKYDLETLDQIGKKGQAADIEEDEDDAPTGKRIRGAGPASPEKRRVQNRVAQQNFRQRRENYVKELERRLESEAAEHAHLRAQLQWLHKQAGPTVAAMLVGGSSTEGSRTHSDETSSEKPDASSMPSFPPAPGSSVGGSSAHPTLVSSQFSTVPAWPHSATTLPSEYDASFLSRPPHLSPGQHRQSLPNDWTYTAQTQLQPVPSHPRSMPIPPRVQQPTEDMSHLPSAPWQPYHSPQLSLTRHDALPQDLSPALAQLSQPAMAHWGGSYGMPALFPGSSHGQQPANMSGEGSSGGGSFRMLM